MIKAKGINKLEKIFYLELDKRIVSWIAQITLEAIMKVVDEKMICGEGDCPYHFLYRLFKR
jgi:hypothetical protein